jgi:predicted dehydrogenase
VLSVALIGCGQWGLNYLRVFAEFSDCKLVAACDLSDERRAEAQSRDPGLRVSADVDSILADASIDAVIVATQARHHFEVAMPALLAGKDLLVEKPMTVDTGEARQLRDVALERGRILMVGHIFRYNAAIQHMAQLITSGAIGDIEYLNFTRTNLGPIRTDVNAVYDLMTHDLSILLYFLNVQPEWVSAQGACFLSDQQQDIAFATFGFPRGVMANIRVSWLDPRKVREITVVGTGKMLVFNDLDDLEPVRIYDKGAIREPTYTTFGEFKLATRRGDVVIPAIKQDEPLRNQVRQFVHSLRTREKPPSDGDDGLRVVEALAAVSESIALRGAPVELAAPAGRTAAAS